MQRLERENAGSNMEVDSIVSDLGGASTSGSLGGASKLIRVDLHARLVGPVLISHLALSGRLIDKLDTVEALFLVHAAEEVVNDWCWWR